ncbi:SH3 domain-containing protein [Streptomyces boninensis]|uniref:DUF7927 domain-containing protein n=1 Tax=Streptomyces boninensis TaxID=2039455 RepID=UPI003B21D257
MSTATSALAVSRTIRALPLALVLTALPQMHAAALPSDMLGDGVPTRSAAQVKSVPPGGTATYRIVVRNTGTAPQTGYTWSDDLTEVSKGADVLPNSLTAASDKGGNPKPPRLNGQTLTWTGDVQPGETITFTYQARIKDPYPAAAGSQLNNTVEGPDSNCATGSGAARCHEAIAIAPPQADAKITLDGPATADAGSTQTWTAVAVNKGPSRAEAVTVRVDTPDGVTPTRVESEPDVPCTIQDGHADCTVGTLERDTTTRAVPGGKVTVRVTGTIAKSVKDGTDLTTAADLAETTTDPTMADHHATVHTKVRNKPATPAPPHHHENGKVVSHTTLNVRGKPSTHSPIIDKLPPGKLIDIECKAYGQNIGGNRIWYKLKGRPGWVPARYVKNLKPIPFCPNPNPLPQHKPHHKPHHQKPHGHGH